MPHVQSYPWSLNMFSGGVSIDISADSLLREPTDYLDSMNMRPTSLSSHAGDISKIHGEQVIYPNINNSCQGGTNLPFPDSYFCIGAIQVINHLVEFWADELGVGISYVRVDGNVVLYPTIQANFPLTFANPLQLDKNDSCVGGEVFVTDNVNPPFILNIADMLENSGINPANGLHDGVYTCTNKYFSSFILSQYQIQPTTQQDHPQFIELMASGTTPNSLGNSVVHGSGGIKVGMYQYSIQYVDASGNTSNWSEATPQIPVPVNALIAYTTMYPSLKVYGASAGTQSQVGVHVRFRITNTNNYASINIRRTTWNVGAAIGTPANDDSVIASINITNGQIGIVDFYDNDNTTVTPVTISASTSNNLTAIQAAKTLRYYNSRLTLMNITYASQDLTNSVQYNTANGVAYPFVRPLGQQGYKDIWNDVYRQSYFRAEKYGFALLCFDNDGNASFALPLKGTGYDFTNYQMPNRRDTLTGASLVASTEVWRTSASISPYPLTSAVNSNGVVSQTFEVFDTANAVQRDYSASSIVPNTGLVKSILSQNGSFPTPDKNAGINPFVYGPIRPVNDADNLIQSNPLSGPNYIPTAAVSTGANSEPSGIRGGTQAAPTNPSNVLNNMAGYNPKGFLPDLFALGLTLDGITSLPPWVSAFTIVRTSPAGRVLAQGQGFYNINSTGKDANSMVWDSPDFATGIADVNTILGNVSSGRYNFQLASALGFFSEVYSGFFMLETTISNILNLGPNIRINPKTRSIDMIAYARILGDNHANNSALFNITSSNTLNGIQGFGGNFYFVDFSNWRNTTHTTTIPRNQEFPLTTMSQKFTNGNYVTAGSAPRQQAYLLNSVNAIYYNNSIGSNYDYDNNHDFNEPLYVANIVDDSKSIVNGLVQDYYQTGTWVKMSSIIGKYTGATNSFVLVDERWQDCIPAELSTDPLANEDRYVYVTDSNGNTQAWINVTYKTAAQISTIQTAITNNGFYVSTKCNNVTVNCYGMYTHTIQVYQFSTTSYVPYTGIIANNGLSVGNKIYTIIFNQTNAAGVKMLPASNSLIYVNYDTCAPIEVFGGDAYIGEYSYAAADCLVDSSGDPQGAADYYGGSGNGLFVPMPYRAFQINQNTIQAFNSNQSALGNFTVLSGYNYVPISYAAGGIGNPQIGGNIRQLLINGIIESRTNTDLFFGNQAFWPNVGYIQRPLQWDPSNATKNIEAGYNGDFPNEWVSFYYGGFRFTPQYQPDYSEIPTTNIAYSKPSSGFTEKLNFCSRALWSDQRSTNEQNSPNLRNFPVTNVYDFDDATGEIKFAWDSSNGGQQGNLYAITEHGVAIGETNKSILTEISGGQLAAVGNSDDTFIQAEVWLTRSIGMNDQMWRSKAEWDNKLYFANKESIYRIYNNKVEDIDSEAGRYGSVTKSALSMIAPGYGSDVTGFWSEMYKEYWLCLNSHRKVILQPSNVPIIALYAANQILPPPWDYYVVLQDFLVDIQCNAKIYLNTLTVVTEIYMVNNTSSPVSVYYIPGNYTSQININPGQTVRAFWNAAIGQWQFDANMINLCNDFIYSELTGKWVGQYKYRFDKYMFDTSMNMYGSRLGATYLLDTGYTMNGQNVGAWVLQTACPKEGFNLSKEYIRIRINSDTIPDTIYFYKNIESYYAGNYHSVINSSNQYGLKNYGSVEEPSYEQYIPRATLSPNYRFQSRYMIYQIMCSEPVEFNLASVSYQWKALV